MMGMTAEHPQVVPVAEQVLATYERLVQEFTGHPASAVEKAVERGEPLDVSRKALKQAFLAHFGRAVPLPRPPEEALEYTLEVIRVIADLQAAVGADAARWLSRPKSTLNGLTPLQLLRTRQGKRQVEDCLGALLDGYYG